MNTSKLLAVFFLSLILHSCQSDNPKEQIFKDVKVPNIINNIPIIPSIKYNGSIFFIHGVVENKTYIFNSDSIIVEFPKSLGRGPLEITQIFGASINFKTNDIYCFDFSLNKLLKYNYEIKETSEFLDIIPKKFFVSEPIVFSSNNIVYFPIVNSQQNYNDTSSRLFLSINLENNEFTTFGEYEINPILNDDILDVKFFETENFLFAIFRASGIIKKFDKDNTKLIFKEQLAGNFRIRDQDFSAQEVNQPRLKNEKANSYSSILNVFNVDGVDYVLYGIDNNTSYYLQNISTKKEVLVTKPLPFYMNDSKTLYYERNEKIRLLSNTTFAILSDVK